MTDSLYFAFRTDQIEMPQPEIIAVPSEDLWCLVRVGDAVLLSDEITHHYTTVGKIDRKDARIYFSDPWSEKSFLLKDKNEAGVAAELKGTLIGISRAEFERVIIGVLTLDDLGLLDHEDLPGCPARKSGEEWQPIAKRNLKPQIGCTSHFCLYLMKPQK